MKACTGLNNIIAKLQSLNDEIISLQDIQTLYDVGAIASWDETNCQGIKAALTSCLNMSRQGCIGKMTELLTQCQCS